METIITHSLLTCQPLCYFIGKAASPVEVVRPDLPRMRNNWRNALHSAQFRI
jgi:hypothetical protein